MMEEDLLREARLQTAILKAAFRDRLEALAKQIEMDKVSAAIVSHLKEHPKAKSALLKAAVMKGVPQGTDASDRTISRRLSDLENKGVVERSGQGSNTEYMLTGLIS
jgi:DNA-binding HxlR family transcriptional regulator